LRMLVIGYGSMGQRHAANARALGHQVLVYDSNAERMEAARRAGHDLLWGCAMDIVGAVVIATPAADHAASAARLLECGYCGPLFVEKPLDVGLTREAFWTAWPHPTTMVGYNLRWQPQARALRLGLEGCDTLVAAMFALSCNMADWPGHNYGEPLLECSHEIDLALWCGVPAELSVVAIDHEGARLEFGHRHCRVDMWWAAEPSQYRRGWVIESRHFNASAGFDSPQALGEQMYRDELVHFLNCAQAGVATECSFEDGLAVLRICEQAKAMAG
jgi:predicted dehydrogenase